MATVEAIDAGDDRDGDGFTDEIEVLHLGTNAAEPCGFDGWPADLEGDGLLFGGDLNSFLFPKRSDDSSTSSGTLRLTRMTRTSRAGTWTVTATSVAPI